MNNMEIDMAIQLIDQAASEELEAVEAAIRSGDSEAALGAIGRAIATLGHARDALQNIPREAQDLGLNATAF